VETGNSGWESPAQIRHEKDDGIMDSRIIKERSPVLNSSIHGNLKNDSTVHDSAKKPLPD
jgi:hypothetical protein